MWLCVALATLFVVSWITFGIVKLFQKLCKRLRNRSSRHQQSTPLLSANVNDDVLDTIAQFRTDGPRVDLVRAQSPALQTMVSSGGREVHLNKKFPPFASHLRGQSEDEIKVNITKSL